MKFTPTNGGFVDAPFSLSFALDLTLGQIEPPAISAPSGAETVTAFRFAPQTVAVSAAGMRQMVYFGTLDADASASETFEAKSGDKVTITARRWSLDYDPEIRLLSPSGKALTENEDHEAAVFALADYDAQIADFAIPAYGVYSVQVTDTYGDSGSFLLTVTIQR